MRSIRVFLRLLSEAPRGGVAALLGLMVLAGLTEGIGLLLLVPLLDSLGGGAGSGNPLIAKLVGGLAALGIAPTLGGLLIAFLGLMALRNSVQYGRERLGAALQHRMVDGLRLRCFTALLGVEWRWLVSTRRSDHANLLLTDVGRVGMALNFGLSLLAALVTLSAYLLAAFTLSSSMTLLALGSGGLVFWLLGGERRKALDLGQSLTRASRSMHGNVQESLTGIKLAKILGSEGRQLEQFTRTVEELREQQLKFSNSTSLSRAIFQFGGSLLLAGYLYVGLEVWKMPAPELLTLVLIFSRLIPLFMSGQQQLHHWLHALPAIYETERLLAECRSEAEPAGEEGPEDWPVNQEVCLKDVTLAYTERDRPALDGVSVCFPASATTAIMGASGAGKSTLADLLMGLLAPDVGALLVDGVPIAGPARRAWRRHVAYVPQEVHLFHDTIRNNLLWGNPDASEAELIQALERAAAEFVVQLPKGLDTPVGDGGVRLSGGERQRIALARALLRRPSLLILDEATSALDMENEARIRDAIERLHGDLTVVIIGHRLPTLEHADRVVLLDAGRIVAQGSWSEVRTQRDMIS